MNLMNEMKHNTEQNYPSLKYTSSISKLITYVAISFCRSKSCTTETVHYLRENIRHIKVRERMQ